MSSILVENDKVTFKNTTATSIQTSGFPTVGTILCWAGNDTQMLDTDYLICDGSEYNKTLYSELFTVIGNRYGGTDPTFKLPDFSNKMPAGSQYTTTMQLNELSGYSGGSVKLENNHFPHTHTVEEVLINYARHFNVATYNGGTTRSAGYSTGAFEQTSTNPINTVSTDKKDITTYDTQTGTLPPYTVFTFIIKAKSTH